MKLTLTTLSLLCCMAAFGQSYPFKTFFNIKKGDIINLSDVQANTFAVCQGGYSMQDGNFDFRDLIGGLCKVVAVPTITRFNNDSDVSGYTIKGDMRYVFIVHNASRSQTEWLNDSTLLIKPKNRP